MTVTIYHTQPNPVSGRVIIRAYGEVFGTGGQSSDEANNYHFADLIDAPPGEGGGAKATFYINNPELRGNGIPAEKIKSAATMRFVVVYQPAVTEKIWKKTTWNCEIRQGKFFDLGG